MATVRRHTALQKRIVTRVVASAGIAAPVLLGVFQYFAMEHTPGYNWRSETISALSSPGTPHPAIMQTAILAYHGVILALVVTAWYILGHHRRLGPGLALMFLYALGGLGTGLFQNDSKTVLALSVTEGTFHDYSAYFALFMFGVTVIAFILGTYGDPRWHRFPQISLVLLLIGAAFAIPIPLNVWAPWHGGLERAVFLLAGLWVAIFSFYVYRIAAKIPTTDEVEHPPSHLGAPVT